MADIGTLGLKIRFGGKWSWNRTFWLKMCLFGRPK